ncbi:hypothetical protein MMC30_004616 [Trapelia coarctata]|nr:hypothetical protein [Trapelia coarctata]
MGAVHKLDLTSDVTHLIVGDTDTPKYKYVAKERPDVKCLLPEWVEAVRQSWMEGGDTNVEALELEHRLPTFAGLRVCVTGFDDLAVRKRLEETVKTNGGEYRGDLTKEVTHLIAFKPAGNKYNFAKTWGIKVVTIEWLQQSLERGMILDEPLYDPLLAPAERGQNAWVRRTVSTSSLAKRPRDEDAGPAPARKLRRTASARLGSQNDGIWTDIVGGGFATENAKQNEWDEVSEQRAAQQPAVLRGGSAKLPNLVQTAGKESQELVLESAHKPAEGFSEEYSQVRRGLFYGRRFFLHGFDARKTEVLERHLRFNEAEILPEITQLTEASPMALENSSFLLVPHASSERDIPSTPTPDPRPQPTVVTDMWIERCLHQKEYVQPSANVTNSPFPHPIPGFEKMVISCTAFEGIELLQASKVIKLLGAVYDEYLTENASVLVCNDTSLNREKIRHAIDWGLPAVKADWLWDSLKEGRRKAFDPYLINPAKQTPTVRKATEQTKSKREARLESDLDSGFGTYHGHMESSQEHNQNQREEAEPFMRRGASKMGNSKSDSSGGTAQNYEPEDPLTTMPPELALDDPRTSAVSYAKMNVSVPLRELSPNSPPKPPKPSFSPAKSQQSASSILTRPEKDKLSTAISSLIDYHKREPKIVPRPVPPETSRQGRRKRKLFGRAPSNLSTCSNGSMNLSRASSVDTMNTDGVGTPLEAAHSATMKADIKDPLTASLLASYDEYENANENGRENFPTTQLVYDDQEAGAWRERLLNKMNGGGKDIKGKSTTPKANGIGTVQDTEGVGLQSVSRRTRHAGGR